MIYLDSAATSFYKPPCVAQAVLDAMQTVGSSGRGAHGLTLAASRLVWHCREQLAALFHAPDPARVCLLSGATEALNTAILGLFSPGDHVITTAAEHNSVLRPLYRTGAELTILPLDDKARVQLSLLKTSLKPHTKAVVCSHASNVTGNVVDLDAIGAFCRAHGLLFIVDAAQTAGVFPIDMQKSGISVLCFAGHKGLLGPQGTGGLCVMPGVDLRPLAVGGSGTHSFSHEPPLDYPQHLEAGTRNVHGIAGLSAALDWLQSHPAGELLSREQTLCQAFYEVVRGMPDVRIYGDWQTPHRAAILSLNLGEEDAGAVSDALYEDFGICTRPGAHCAPLLHQACGTAAQGMVRFSFSHFNTEAQVETAVSALRTLTGG